MLKRMKRIKAAVLALAVAVTMWTPVQSVKVEAAANATVSTYKDLVSAISKAESAGGGTVYITGTDISCSGQIKLAKSKANVSLVGVKNSDGTYPVLDFTEFRADYIGKASSDGQVGVRITGSNYTIQNLIVEKAPDNGIQIKGTSAGNNKVENCITRYNNDAGLQITQGAYGNTIRYVTSYRNCDVYTRGGNADGFAPKLATGTGNTFYGCYSFENSDDGWDSYDKLDGLSKDFSYEECACWNNGDPTIFTGEYDYKNGDALDTDLYLVELITKQDSSFAKNYSNGKFSLPTASFVKTDKGTISLSNWTGSLYDGNPNGFKFGSVNTNSSCKRTVKNCLAFGHSKKGFDNNNSSCTASFTNCVGFDNGYNYYIQPFTVTGFSNCIGFSGSNSDKLPSNAKLTTASSSTQSSIRSTVKSTVASIKKSCKANKIPGAVFFAIYGSASTDNGNTDNGNTDNGNTDSGNTDNGNTDSGNTDNGNSDSTVTTKTDITKKTVTLSATKFAYTGKSQKPTVTIKGLTKNTDYTVTYSSDCVNIGAKTVKITGKGKYTGTIKKSFNIIPKKVSLSSVKTASKAATITWKKDASVQGYEVYMATSKKGTYTRLTRVVKNSTVSYKKTGLTKGKTYYFKVRAYKTVNEVKYNGAYSSIKSVKVK